MENKKEQLLKLISSEEYVPMDIKELEFLLEIKEEKGMFIETINTLKKEGKIYENKKRKLVIPESAGIVAGTFVGTAKKFGFVITDTVGEEDIFIPPNKVNGAIHKDRVFCRVSGDGNSSRKREGEIIQILEKGFNNIVGTFVERKREDYVIPDNKKLSSYIRIDKKNRNGAVEGHKVVVKINRKESVDGKLKGKVVEILGHKNDPGVDILSIIYALEIPTEFPNSVLAEIENIPNEVLQKDKINRTDLRKETLLTVDGVDTKDVDDAISISKLSNGNFKLGVHIADVTHYVKENSPLDKEALKRGTSVYLIDTVIPMLPHKLSNGICSLNEGVDRLALSCEMEIDLTGNVVNHKIFNSLVNIEKKTNYTVVNDLLNTENSIHKEEYKNYLKMFTHMDELRKILKKKRFDRGAINFEFPEAKIIVDEDGHPLDIVLSEKNDATNLIEEFMLISNETIAEEYYWLDAPFVYRSHEEPDEAKIETLVDFIRGLGYSIKGKGYHSKDIQNLLTETEGKPEEDIISRVVLRSMKQARYTEENFGHFGLGAKFYCHFTSPIRRYPDLQIHRIIKENLAGKLINENLNHFKNILPNVSLISSKTERRAEEAEREVDTLKKVEFMEDKIGEVFEGIISSVVSWGVYIVLPNTVEGLVRVDYLGDDKYIFNEKELKYTGVKTKEEFKLGDKVKVELTRADALEREIDFIIYDPDSDDRNLKVENFL